jgi:crotonobetainyl-CoA:carnitine CoA-transferase CaiB-like acyl-CoA transferase
VYRAQGSERSADQWLALTIENDHQWSLLCAQINAPDEWLSWSDQDRHHHHDAIDRCISQWSVRRPAAEAAGLLQQLGVAAAPVVDAHDLVHDPHLRANGFFVDLAHPEAGKHAWPRLPARFGRSDVMVSGSAPCLGQHNHEVLAEFLGYSKERLHQLNERHVLRTQPREN